MEVISTAYEPGAVEAEMVPQLGPQQGLPRQGPIAEAGLRHRDSSAQCDRGPNDGARFEQHDPGRSCAASAHARERSALAARD